MAYEVTATRKRPQQFEAVAGQDFVISTITNAVTQGRIAHAYLFSGPRGVGKTTTARLLAKALNCEHGPTATPCGQCDNCLSIARGVDTDVIEIDGASNTSVNDVRTIKDEISFPPQHSRYKIYIIDEVHMLSNSAFNALLKTIEEPPQYVVFIFATTETQKVPATIRSRCQQFNFQLLNIETIKRLLRETCEETGVKAEDQALFWIAKESAGGMRDAYTLFDQVVSFSDGDITMEKIRTKLGLTGIDNLNEVMLSLIGGRKGQAIEKIDSLIQRGVSVEQCVRDFADYFRVLLLMRKGITGESVLGEQVSAFPKEVRDAYSEMQLEAGLSMFLNLYRDIRYSLNPRFELELAVSRLNTLRFLASGPVIMEQLTRLKNDLVLGKLTPTNPKLHRLPDLPVRQLPEEPRPEPQPVHQPEPKAEPVKPQPVQAEPEPAPAPAPVIAQQPEPAVVSAPAPVAEPEPQKPTVKEPTQADLPAIMDYCQKNDPQMYSIFRPVRKLGMKNGAACLVFSSSFALQNAKGNEEAIRQVLGRVLNYTGAVVLEAEIRPETKAVQDATSDPNSPEALVRSMLGGIKE